MLRATTWTLGLFGAGTALTRVFASGWIEPLVLLLLGGALLYVSARTGARTGARTQRERGAATAAGAAAAKGAAASAS
jgi:hypothetical protein